jgi:hypothetical protein
METMPSVRLREGIPAYVFPAAYDLVELGEGFGTDPSK